MNLKAGSLTFENRIKNIFTKFHVTTIIAHGFNRGKRIVGFPYRPPTIETVGYGLNFYRNTEFLDPKQSFSVRIPSF